MSIQRKGSRTSNNSVYYLNASDVRPSVEGSVIRLLDVRVNAASAEAYYNVTKSSSTLEGPRALKENSLNENVQNKNETRNLASNSSSVEHREQLIDGSAVTPPIGEGNQFPQNTSHPSHEYIDILQASMDIDAAKNIQSEAHRQNFSKNSQSKSPMKSESTQDIGGGESRMLYSVADVPPWYLSILLGFQHFLIMFGGTAFQPILLSKALCISDDNQVVTSQLIGSTFFVSGLCTLLQTTFGVRLSILQGGTHDFIVAGMAILSMAEWKCPGNFTEAITPGFHNTTTVKTSFNQTTTPTSNDDLWKPRMREIQGAIIVSSLFHVFIGLTGIMGFLFRFVGPLSIAPPITLGGLSLFTIATEYCESQWWVALATMLLIAAFSQYSRKFEVPCCVFNHGVGCTKVGIPIFQLFPVILAVSLTWTICAILTATHVFHPYDHEASTSRNLPVMHLAPWFRIPYPGQWGMPTVSTTAVFGMLSAVLSSMIESVGDYYACARMSRVPSPPMHAINRGIVMEGLGCVLAGLIGTGTATTSYNQNVGAIGVTKVASRRVMQVCAVLMIFFGVFGKFGAFFVTIPPPIMGGVLAVMFGMIAAVGISNLQFVDLNSTRNLFIVGFSLYLGLEIPRYIGDPTIAMNTGFKTFDQTVKILLSNSMFVGGLTGFVLDNTIPGTAEERGLIRWRDTTSMDELERPTGTLRHQGQRKRALEELERSIYDIPFISTCLRRCHWTKYVPIFPSFDENILPKKLCRRSRTNGRLNSNSA